MREKQRERETESERERQRERENRDEKRGYEGRTGRRGQDMRGEVM